MKGGFERIIADTVIGEICKGIVSPSLLINFFELHLEKLYII